MVKEPTAFQKDHGAGRVKRSSWKVESSRKAARPGRARRGDDHASLKEKGSEEEGHRNQRNRSSNTQLRIRLCRPELLPEKEHRRTG